VDTARRTRKSHDSEPTDREVAVVLRECVTSPCVAKRPRTHGCASSSPSRYVRHWRDRARRLTDDLSHRPKLVDRRAREDGYVTEGRHMRTSTFTDLLPGVVVGLRILPERVEVLAIVLMARRKDLLVKRGVGL
jgi:hypothetical protein